MSQFKDVVRISHIVFIISTSISLLYLRLMIRERLQGVSSQGNTVRNITGNV